MQKNTTCEMCTQYLYYYAKSLMNNSDKIIVKQKKSTSREQHLRKEAIVLATGSRDLSATRYISRG